MESLTGLFDSEHFLKFAVALVALLNPLYGIPIFLGLTKGYTPAERSRTANIITLTVFIAATVATLVGEEILAFFGINVPSFQIAGGIIVLGIGLSMLNDEPRSSGDAKAHEAGAEKKSNIAIVPLSIPLTIGPGCFATIILFAHLMDDGSEIVTMLPAVVLICLLLWAGLYFADSISRLLGETVISVVTRIMALILTAVAVEMIINGGIQVYQTHFAHTPAG
ncbi:MAG: MarC family protein [Alphaproteobacteria bacterium]|nr:MarC family protein [Alphaproteobacteria bacterium]